MADAGPLGPATVVVLGLLSAASFGASDFGGGLSSRYLPILGVTLIVNFVGGVIALVAALLVAEAPPTATALLLGCLAGAVGVVGILGLYHGLAVGRMGVVAPVVGVVGAAIPVVVGLFVQGAPRVEVGIGIALALVAVVVVSSSQNTSNRRSGFEFALLGGLGIGLFNILISRLPEGSVWWPLLALKITVVAILALAVVLARRPWRVQRRSLGTTAAIGVGDMSGNVFYVLATQTGRLDIAAVLSSLYPVVTVVLAIVVLREHVNRRHAAGIATAAVGVAFIALGSNATG
jgi:drug/metabolite transporter (DMT)-like permease